MKILMQLLVVTCLMLSQWSYAFGSESNIEAIGVQQISASGDDNAVSNNGSMQWVGYATHRLGTNKYTCAVIPFQLPVLGAGETIATASFTTHLNGLSGNLTDGVDLYAVPYQATSAVSGTDYFGGAYDSDANATALQQGFFNSSSATGSHTSSATANTALADFLNLQYANGAVGGEYVFIRLSMDGSSGSNYNYWDIASQNNTTIGNRPILTIDIQPGNTAPVLASISNQSVEEGSALNVDVSATDSDGDPITLTSSNLPSFATFTDNQDGTGSIAINSAIGDAGTYSNISITANDGSATDAISFDLNVTPAPVNNAPVVANISNQSVEEGSVLSVSVSATDSDGDVLTLSASSLPSFATFTDHGDGTGTIAISPSAGDASNYTSIGITANDGTDTHIVSFDLTVTAPSGNVAPVLAAIGNQSIIESSTSSISITASDTDGDVLNLSASGLPSFASLTDHGNGTATLALSPQIGDAGSYTNIVVSVSDGTVSSSETISITVSVVPAGTVYYLDPVNGDMANDGSQANPWHSLASVAYIKPTIADGATLYLMDGNHGTPYVQNYTFANGITIKPLSGHNPTVTSISLNNCTNWTFEDVMFDGTTSTITKDGFLVTGDVNSSHITFSNCTIQSAASSSSWTKTDWYNNVKGGIDMRAGYITVENTTIKNIYHALSLRGAHSTASNNLIDNFAGDAIRGLGSFSTFEYNIVRDCYIDDYAIQHDDGFQAYNLESDPKIEGMVLRYNKILLFEDPITQFVIDNNLIGTLMQGLIITDGYADSWIVENNLIVNNQAHGISLYGARNCRVQNNTVIQHPYFTDTTVPRIYLDDQGKTGQANFNNIVRNNIAGQFTDWTFDATSTIQNNLDVTTNTSGYSAHFADYANLDFHLKTGSAAIDAGINTDVTATDLDGNARVADGTVDAGAYEFNAGTGGNARPVLVAIGNAQLNEGNTVTKSLSATDADGDAITFSASNLPSFAVLTDNGDGTGSIAINPQAGDEGTYNITVSATDGTDADTEDVTITINPVGGPNNAPVIAAIANQNLEEGSSVTISVFATDADGDAITLSASNLPSYAVFTDNGDGTGSVVVSPQTGDAETVTTVITAADNTDSGTTSFVINVYAPGTVAGNTYYVDPVGGSNSNDGSQSSPWSSIQSSSILNGDLVYLLDGNYGNVYIGNMARTEDVTFRALSGHTPVFNKLTIDNSQHLVFDGITVTGNNAGLGKEEFMTTGNANTTHITIKNSTFKCADDISTWTKIDWYANVTGGVDFRGGNITLENNLFTNIYHAVSLRGQYSYMANNVIDNFAGDAIRGLGSFSTYEYNIVRDCYINDYAIQHDDGFQAYQLTGDPIIENVTIRYNQFLLFEDPITQFVEDNELIGNLMQGIIITDGYGDGWVVENNLVMNDQTHGITLYGARNCKIQNNTVVQHPYYTDTDLVPWISCQAQGKTGQDNFNNIIRNNIGAKYTTWTFDATSTVENNINIDESNYNNYLPYFQDYVGGDFRLKAGSLAIDAGVATDLASLDLDGNARVFGPSPDAGCYEYSAAADSQAPTVATSNNTFIDDVFTFSFSESVTPITAQNLANYSIDNGVTVTSATLQGDNRSIVMYVSTLGGNQVNTLTVTNVQDYAGNTISAGNTGMFKFNCDTLWASTFQDDQWGYNPPAGAMDGDLNTKWAADGTEWLQKNFCSPVTLTSVDIAFGVGDERTYDFSIEVSNDGVNYTEVYNGTSSGSTLALENFDFTDVSTRYVKIIGGGNSASSWNNYQEVQFNTSGSAPSNNAPAVSSIAAQSVEEGNAINVAVSATDADGDVLILSVNGLPSFASFTDNGDGTGSVSVVSSVGDVGNYTGITVSASDGTDVGSTSFDLAVTSSVSNSAPIVTSIPAQSVEEGNTLNVAVSASDSDGDALVLTASNLPTFTSFTDNGDGTGTMAISAASGDAGGYLAITISANDGTITSSKSFDLTVTAPAINNAPVLNSLGNQSVDEDASLSVAISATDADGDALTISATGLPSFAVLTDNGDGTGTIAIDPLTGDAGTYSGIVLTVSDGTDNDSETIDLTVNAVVVGQSFTIYSHDDDQEIRTNGTSQWVGQTTARVGGASSAYDAGLIMPFQLPVLPAGHDVAQATFSMKMLAKVNSPAGNMNLSGISYKTTSSVAVADYSAGATIVETGFITNSTTSGVVTLSDDQELADFINAQYDAGAVAGDYIFLKVVSDIDEANYSYWNMSTGDDNANGNKPTLIITSGSAGSSSRVVMETSILNIIEATSDFSVYPNPSRGGDFNLIIPNTLEMSQCMVRIYNVMGMEVFSERLDVSQDTNRYPVNAGTILSSGYFIVQVSDGNTSFETKIIVR